MSNEIPMEVTGVNPTPTLRQAAAEALLAGALLLSDVQRQSANWNEATQAKASEARFRAALETLRGALA